MKFPWSKSVEAEPVDAYEQEKYFEQTLEVARADTERITKNQSRARRRRALVWSCMGLGILSFASSCNTIGQFDSFKNDIRSSAAAAATQDSPGRFAATQALQQWLASSPAPLPGGQMVNWSGAQQLTKQSQEDDDGTKIHREIDRFTVIDGVGRGYTATVEVAYTDTGQTAVIAGPSIVPRVISSNSDFAGSSYWPGLTSVAASPDVNTAVQQWAQAYTSGDASALRQAVADPNAAHIYVPISDVTSVTAKVNASAEVEDGIIAQVTITSKWAGRKYENNRDPAPSVFDVLITGANTAAPRVVAWGAPGDGPNLKPYANAIVLNKAEVENGAGSSSGSSGSATPSASPSSVTRETGEGTAPSAAKTSNSTAPSASASSSAKPSASSASSTSSPSKK